MKTLLALVLLCVSAAWGQASYICPAEHHLAYDKYGDPLCAMNAPPIKQMCKYVDTDGRTAFQVCVTDPPSLPAKPAIVTFDNQTAVYFEHPQSGTCTLSPPHEPCPIDSATRSDGKCVYVPAKPYDLNLECSHVPDGEKWETIPPSPFVGFSVRGNTLTKDYYCWEAPSPTSNVGPDGKCVLSTNLNNQKPVFKCAPAPESWMER